MAWSRSAFFFMIARNRRAASGSSIAPSWRVSMKPLSEVTGVRISCEAFATKSRRIRSSRRMLVTSLSTIRAPMRLPVASVSPVPCAWMKRSPASSKKEISRSWVTACESVSATNSCSSGLRTASWMLRPRTCSARTPSSRAAAPLRLIRFASRSKASTPSTMLESTASSSWRWRTSPRMRSSSWAAMRFISSATTANSSKAGTGSGCENSPRAKRAAPRRSSRSGTARRRASRALTRMTRARAASAPRTRSRRRPAERGAERRHRDREAHRAPAARR